MSGTGNSSAQPTAQPTLNAPKPAPMQGGQQQAPAYGGQQVPGGNPYLTQTISDALGDTVNAYNKVVTPGYTSAHVGSGSFGNSGVSEMQAESLKTLQTSLGRQANDMRAGQYQFDRNMGQRGYEFDQNMDRGIYNDTFAQNQQGFANAMALLGMQNQFGQQALGYGNAIQDTPMNYYNQFTNTANSIGQGFASNNVSGSGGSPIMGMLGGAQLGAQFGGWGGTNSMGNSVGGWNGTPQAGFFYGNGGSGD